MPLAALLAALLASGPAASAAAPSAEKAPPVAAPSRTWGHSVPHSERGERYYAVRYGVDQLHVRWTASGQSLEFRYRVIDPDRAALLNDRRVAPVLTDQRTGVKLTVPALEKIGSLRQTAAPVAGKEYWMVFQNAGRAVKPGDKVDIAIGIVRFSGLYVE
jgi:hypothetical protein